MRKSLLGMAIALCGFMPASVLAADYAPPPPAYYPMPVQSSCCFCPSVQRGLWVSASACGASYVHYQPSAPVYDPGYEVGVRYKKARKDCWRHHGHWVCR